jgi:hypothetical protein
VIWHETTHLIVGLLCGGTYGGFAPNFFSTIPWDMSAVVTINNDEHGFLRTYSGVYTGLILATILISIQWLLSRYYKSQSTLAVLINDILEFTIFWAGLVTSMQATAGIDSNSDPGILLRV